MTESRWHSFFDASGEFYLKNPPEYAIIGAGKPARALPKTLNLDSLLLSLIIGCQDVCQIPAQPLKILRLWQYCLP